MAEADPYTVLELPWGASEAECRRAFRRLALRYHPDRNPGDVRADERFKLISAAYQRLKSAGFRSPRASQHARASSKPPPWSPPNTASAGAGWDFSPREQRPESWPDGSRIHYPTQKEVEDLIRDMGRRQEDSWFRRAVELWLWGVTYLYAGLAICVIPAAVVLFCTVVVLAIREWLRR